jgi:cobalamin biosynthesis Mg chelatase CobN
MDKGAYDYLKKYSGKYNINNLKKKLIESGYSKKVVDEAAAVLQNETGKKSSIMPRTKTPVGKMPWPVPQQKSMVSAESPSKNMVSKKVNFNVPKIDTQKFRFRGNSDQNKNQMKVQQSVPQTSAVKTNVQNNKQPVQKTKSMQNQQKQVQQPKQAQTTNMQMQQPKSKKWLWILIIVAVLILVGAAAYYFLYLR